jgi:hypothetical protein
MMPQTRQTPMLLHRRFLWLFGQVQVGGTCDYSNSQKQSDVMMSLSHPT